MCILGNRLIGIYLVKNFNFRMIFIGKEMLFDLEKLMYKEGSVG